MNVKSLLDIAAFTPKSLQQPNSWIGHLPFAALIMKECAPNIFVELGTHSGNSYFTFCQTVVEQKLRTQCFAIDTWQGDEQAGQYNEDVFLAVERHNLSQYASFSKLLRMTFDEATRFFEDGSIDLLHIDGLHTYEAVKHDFETWLPKLSDRAIVLFHDTQVFKRDFGVWQLWEKLHLEYPSFEFKHAHGLGVLLVGKQIADSVQEFHSSWHTQKQNTTIEKLFELLGQRLEYQFTIKQLNHALLMRDQDINNLWQGIDIRDKEIVKRDLDIQNLWLGIDNRDKEIAKRDLDIQNLWLGIDNRDKEIAKRDLDIQNLWLGIDNRDKEIAERDQIIDAANKQIIFYDDALQKLYQSRSWRATRPFRFIHRIIKHAIGH